MKALKTSYGDVAKLTSTEAAYLAALIDGEGTIALTRHNSTENRRLEISIGNTDFNMIQWTKETIGAGQIRLKRPQKEGYKMNYVYTICNRQAFNFLIQIVAHLKTYKRKRAELILKNYSKLTPRNGKYSEELKLQKEEFVKEFFAIPQ